jgi:acyl-CoA thioesterase-1
MRIRVSVALQLLLVLAVPAASAESTIVVLGDSLSSGYGLVDAPSWVELLEDRIAQEAYEYSVVNASIAGDTSSSGVSRLPGLLNRHSPAIVIIELGGNDGLRGLPVSLVRDNLSRMIELVVEHGATPVLTGIQIPPNYGPTYTRQFAAVYHDLAERFGLAFVEFLMDGVALDPTRMQRDQIHPNGAGQPVLFENVWSVLTGVL